MVPLKGDVVQVTKVHRSSAHGEELVGAIIKVRWASMHRWHTNYCTVSYTYEDGNTGFCGACQVGPVPSETPSWEV